MVEVTEADRLAAAQLIENYWHGDPSKAGNGMRRLAQSYKDGHAQGVWVTAFATHRVEAAKAERDRLREVADELELALNAPSWSMALTHVHNAVASLADALGSQP